MSVTEPASNPAWQVLNALHSFFLPVLASSSRLAVATSMHFQHGSSRLRLFQQWTARNAISLLLMSHQQLRSCSVSRSQPSTPTSTFEGPAQALAQLPAPAGLTNAITTLGSTAGPRMLLSTALVLMKSIPVASSSRSLAMMMKEMPTTLQL